MLAIKYFKEKKSGQVYVGQKELDDGKERKCLGKERKCLIINSRMEMKSGQ